MKILLKPLFITAFAVMLFQASFAQKKEDKAPFLYSNKVSFLAGLIQPTVLKGGNFEVTYFTNKMSFDYSHGFSLDMSGGTITGDAKTQKLAYHLPYSTGLGIGYRFSSFFDVRLEPKMHRWEVYYDGESPSPTTLIKSYKTYTVGLGAYYRYIPFMKEDNWLQGITTSTSLRWWPNVGSSLPGNQFVYENKKTNETETLKAANIGVAGSPFIFNISIGYTFGIN